MIRLAYSLVGILLTPALHLWLRRRCLRGKENPARLGERFGHASASRPPGKLVWLHAASVGETQSVLTLVRQLLQQHDTLHILITTGTVTSAALIAQQQLSRTIHQFIPVDTPTAVRRFLTHWQPDLALWVESEFWPQLLWQTRDRGIPMLLINARISATSFTNWQRWPRLITQLLGSFTTIYAGSEEDRHRLDILGATNTRYVGNLKYDAQPLPVDHAAMDALAPVFATRPVWVAASTHANEEQMIAELHQSLAAQLPGLLTVIIPRHAARGDGLATELRGRHVTLAQRSIQEPITAKTEIYLADTMGELGLFFRLSDIVFLGGSLIAHGGHNPLEPARLNCAILTGPHTHNFNAMIEPLQRAGGICVVQNMAQLQQQLQQLFTDKTLRHSLAENAAAVVNQAKGASEVILEECCQFIGGELHAHS